MLLVIPAIDLRAGRCVRLQQGRYEDEAVFFDDPVKMAKLWRVQNARVLHLVDVDDGGTTDDATPSNRDVIRQIASALDIPVEVAGGIGSMEDIEALFDAGVYRVVLGRAAVRDLDFVEEAVQRHTCNRVVASLHAREGTVRDNGEAPSVDAIELALALEDRGIRRIVYSDVGRDGMLVSPNLDAYRTLGQHLHRARITAAGGVSGYRDLLRLQELAPLGVDSVIIGRALYENRFPCQQFWCWNRKEMVDLDTFSTARFAGSIDRCD